MKKTNIPNFDEKDAEQIRNWIRDWSKWTKEKGVGRPDWTTETILLPPLILALIKSEHRLSKLTFILIVLTVILAIETLILIFK